MGQHHSVLALDIVSLGITALIRALSQHPQPDNETIRRMEAALREKEEAERRTRDAQNAERRAREQREAAERRQREAEESMARAREEGERIRKQAEEAERRAREEREMAERKANEEREEAMRKAREMEEQARKEREAAQKYAKELEEQAKMERRRAEEQRWEADRAREEADLALKKANQAENALKKGIKMVTTFTRREYEEAKLRMEYREDKMHFAVVGTAGSGKSTLINAFRGISEYDEGIDPRLIATTAAVECTSTATRYPDPRREAPYSSFVWYDIPGAGTQSISDATYFTDHGLYLFDFIILVYDVRFTSTDAAIIRNCLRFGIPCFIVRSKADMHIENLFKAKMRNKRFNPRLVGHTEMYEQLRDDFIRTTREDLRDKLQILAKDLRDMKKDGQLVVDIDDSIIEQLENMRVYIVSAASVHNLVTEGDADNEDFVETEAEELIDEKELCHDLLGAAIERRGGSAAKLVAKAAKLSL